jgi:hypothetical protein
LISAIKDLDDILFIEGARALAFPLIWRTITAALQAILPSQHTITTLPNEPEQF